MNRILSYLVLGLVGCGAGASGLDPASPAGAGASASAAAQGPPAQWWCFAFNQGQAGLCQPDRARCLIALEDMRRSQTDPDERLGACSPQPHAVCFDARSGGKAVEAVCHPTFATCRSYHDHYRVNRRDEVRLVSACRSTEPAPEPTSSGAASQDPDEAAHWWCSSYEAAGVGACDRSRSACEGNRSYLLAHLAPDQRITDCEAVQTAICFEIEDVPASTRRQRCQPTQWMCESAARLARAVPPRGAVVEDCRPID